jgi:hypothetical protein
MRLVTSPSGGGVPLHESDEWVKTFGEIKVRYSYQLLTTGFSASAEILEPVDAAMVYTHTHINLPAPINRAQIEEEFMHELSHAGQWRAAAKPGRYRSAS